MQTDLGGVGWTAPFCCLRDDDAGAVHASNQRVNGRYGRAYAGWTHGHGVPTLPQCHVHV